MNSIFIVESKLQIQQRVGIFLWLLANEKILTIYNCWRRQLTRSPLCSMCEERQESCFHVVQDCKHAKAIWSRFIPPKLQHNFFSLPVKELIFWNLSRGSLAGPSQLWNIRFSISCWNV